MAWFSSGFSNLKEQLNSLINDDDDTGNNNSSSYTDSKPADTEGKCETLPSSKNYAETSEQDETSRRSRSSLAQRRLVLQYSKILNDLTSDVNVLNTSLDQVLGDVFKCIDENERLREEINIRKDCDAGNADTPIDKIKSDDVAAARTMQDCGDLPDSIECGPKTVDKGCNTMTMETSTVNTGDDGEITQKIENLMIEMDEINEKLNQSEKKWRKTTDDGRSYVTIETNTLADYTTLAHQRDVLWDKLKVSFIWPTIAKFKNAKISELSVPDSIKEVFQPAPGSRSNDNALGQLVQNEEPAVQSVEERESTVHPPCLENDGLSTATATSTDTQKAEKIIDIESMESSPAQDAAAAEINRLRNHLVAVEQAYTNELLQCEEEIKILRTELKSKEEKLNSIAASYTATNLTTNKTLERLQIEVQQLSTDNQQLTTQLSRCRKDLEESQVDNRNLRSALDFFRKDKDSEIYQVTEKLKSEIQVLRSDNERLRESLASLRNDIEDSQQIFKKNETLNAELKTKLDEIVALRLKVEELSGQRFQSTNTNTMEEGVHTSKMATVTSTLDVEAKMRLNLIKNVAFSYLISDSPNTKAQSLRILADVLDFSDCEKTKIGIKAAIRPGEKTKNDQSLIDEFIRFVEKESQHPKTIQAGAQPQHLAQMQQKLRSSDPTSSAELSLTAADRDAVISTNTSMNLPPARNLTSSSILLKDALNSKDI